jgi:hypothetical protein
MLVSAQVSNEQKLSWLKLWNQSEMLKEEENFPKQGFLDRIFDKWLHKATLWP